MHNPGRFQNLSRRVSPKRPAYFTPAPKNMTKQLLGLCSFAVLATASTHAQNLIDNGDFETNFSTVGTTFELTPNWYNRGAGDNQSSTARSTNNVFAGSYSAQINDRYNVVNAATPFDSSAFGAIVHSQRTTYVIGEDDQFDLSYNWTSGFNWNAGFDEVRFVLFATNNDALGGTVVWSSVLDSGVLSQTAETWKSIAQTSSVVTSAAEGRNLFINFYGFQNNGVLSASTGFARVDNISVVVTSAIPEPGSFALLSGFFALGFVGLRRRGRS